MKRRNIVLINLVFIVLTIISLIISFIFQTLFLIPFFFLPICCFLPFAFKSRSFRQVPYEPYKSIDESQIEEQLKKRLCPKCGGEIREPIAKFCYHCGEKLNIE